MAEFVGTTGTGTLSGTSGDDVFKFEGGNTTIIGNGGDDTISLADAPTAVTVNLATGVVSGWGSATLTGVNKIYGGWHGGALTGNANTSYIEAPGGDTVIHGGSASANIFLGYGNDTVTAGNGNDEIYVVSGNNTIDGGGGYNGVSYDRATSYVTVDLYAGAWHPGGYDSLKNIVNITGGSGGNTLKGDWQNNIIIGGSGSDIIEGREGNDTLTGAAGSDVFVMDTGTGQTTITDFAHGSDTIDLSAYGVHSFAAIQALTAQAGGNAVITLGGGSLTLSGVAASSLSASDFVNLGSETFSTVDGLKVAAYHGAASQYGFSLSGPTVTITDNVAARDGTTVLANVQEAQFTDNVMVVFDLHSSQDLLVYELYQASFARMPDNGGFRYWATYADNTNASAVQLADQFLAAPEFTQKYGANPTNTQYITALYQNVLGRAPDQAGLDFWASTGETRDQLMVAFAVSKENVQLIGAHVQNGYWTAH